MLKFDGAVETEPLKSWQKQNAACVHSCSYLEMDIQLKRCENSLLPGPHIFLKKSYGSWGFHYIYLFLKFYSF